jgi:glycosyltransferase involved in cell wall biosynthesis
MSDLPDYAIVTPVRDEVAHFRRTAAAIVAQEHPPAQWIIVDDGSADGTEVVADDLAAEHDFITVIHRPRRETRERGGPIVRAFKAGLDAVEGEPEFVVKLDGDLHLPPHYFAWVAQTFAAHPDAGIVGGVVYVHDGATWVRDRVAAQSVHGAIKAYRTTALAEIGGLHESMGWDGIDEYAARARGWRVYPLTELQVLHYAARGSKQRWVRSRLEEGRGAWFMGYLPAFVAVRAAFRMLVETPRVLGGITLAAGYLDAALRRRPVVPDPQARQELRAEQAQRLRALAKLDRRAFDPAGDVPDDGGPAFSDPRSPIKATT